MFTPRTRYAEVLLFALLCWTTMATAQSMKSPEVNTDGSVTFHLEAPSAKTAEVHLELASGMSTLAMSKTILATA